jgi:hypothetical protein
VRRGKADLEGERKTKRPENGSYRSALACTASRCAEYAGHKLCKASSTVRHGELPLDASLPHSFSLLSLQLPPTTARMQRGNGGFSVDNLCVLLPFSRTPCSARRVLKSSSLRVVFSVYAYPACVLTTCTSSASPSAPTQQPPSDPDTTDTPTPLPPIDLHTSRPPLLMDNRRRRATALLLDLRG